MAELETRLRALKAGNPDLPVLVQGDARVPYQKVVDVVARVGALGITHLGLVTRHITR